MMSENPSTQSAEEPETPAILYPSGGINVCLLDRLALLSVAAEKLKIAYPEPPVAFP